MSSSGIKESSFSFEGYLIKKTVMKLQSMDFCHSYHLDIHPSGTLDQSGKKLAIELTVTVSDDHKKLHLSFVIEGTFKYQCDNFDELMSYICINGPAILFPYVRAYVSNITALAGCAPVVIPTLNMEGVGKRLLEDIKSKLTSSQGEKQ